MTQVDFYDKEQIDAMEIGTPDDAASASGSLWARIKNAVARIVSLETADTNNVKKTGTSTVTGDVQVPTTPATPTSVVNSVYVNDATVGVNNIAHKTGDENISGVKKVDGLFKFAKGEWTVPIEINNTSHSRNDGVVSGSPQIQWTDKDGNVLGLLRVVINADRTTRLQVLVKNSDGSDKALTVVAGDVI